MFYLYLDSKLTDFVFLCILILHYYALHFNYGLHYNIYILCIILKFLLMYEHIFHLLLFWIRESSMYNFLLFLWDKIICNILPLPYNKCFPTEYFKFDYLITLKTFLRILQDYIFVIFFFKFGIIKTVKTKYVYSM